MMHAAYFKVCADGGANRLQSDLPPREAARLPDKIVGDLDSLHADVRAFFAERGVSPIDLSHDQDTTDLDKSLQVVLEEIRAEGEHGGKDVIVIAGLLPHSTWLWRAWQMHPRGRHVML